MKKIKVYIMRDSHGIYSLYMDDDVNLPYSLVGEGATEEEAIDEWNRAYNDMRELFKEQGRKFVEAEFDYVYDIPALIYYYGEKITYEALSRLTGIPAARLSEYALGYLAPSPKTKEKIQTELNRFGKDLCRFKLLRH